LTTDEPLGSGEGRRVSLAKDANAGAVALITGGGTGIGRATALAFAHSGADVAICGRRPAPLAATRAAVESAGRSCLALPADVRDSAEVTQVVSAVLERYGRIDVLVNNAGGQFEAAAEEITERGWRAVHALAVDAAWSLTRAVARSAMLPARRGLVVFIGFSPRRGIPGMVHAAAARAAVENLAAGLALEWGRYGLRAVCVAPGNIATEGLAGYGEEQVAAWEAAVPLGRLGRPEEVGEVIAFLASPGGAYVTGTTVVVDGGVDAWGQALPPPTPGPWHELDDSARAAPRRERGDPR
jgi:citronellol/citronellal dehydrogenase